MKTAATKAAFLRLYYQGASWSDVGDAQGSDVIYVSAHTSDPGPSGKQTTHEANFGGYARVAISRSPSGWKIQNETCTNAAPLQFAECLSGNNTITHIATGKLASGPGDIAHVIELESPRSITLGAALLFGIGAIQIIE